MPSSQTEEAIKQACNLIFDLLQSKNAFRHLKAEFYQLYKTKLKTTFKLNQTYLPISRFINLEQGRVSQLPCCSSASMHEGKVFLKDGCFLINGQ